MTIGILVGFSGHTEVDPPIIFAPYMPGMNDEQIAQVNAQLFQQRIPDTEMQIQIMRLVRNETS